MDETIAFFMVLILIGQAFLFWEMSRDRRETIGFVISIYHRLNKLERKQRFISGSESPSVSPSWSLSPSAEAEGEE